MNTRSHNPKVSALRALTGNEFLSFGSDEVMYAKQMVHDGRPAFGLYSASGGMIAIVDDLALAAATAIQNDVYMAQVH